MEKKSSARTGYPPAKGIVDTKKVQDVSHKPWPRSGGRRRELPSGYQKPENNRKPIPQRSKMFDKRPKPRGFNSGDVQDCGKEETQLEPIEAELGSVFIQGAKKQSLNHLLNFHYVPRDSVSSYGPSRNDRGHHRWFGTQKHKYNKEQFLQANCQFVVNSDGDYNLYMKNPDLLVNWDSIEQIRVQGSEFPSCPICLYEPVAGKMTRCGHVYCWSCILHYLALSDKTWRKCPICFEAVHKNDLKSVVAKPYSAFNVGDIITMRLMRRERGSLVAVPIEQADINNLLHISEIDANTIYSKLLLANLGEIVSIIEKERSELKVQLSEDENCPEKCFIEQAMEQLQIRENSISSKEKVVVIQKSKSDKSIKDTSIGNQSISLSNIDHEKYFECAGSDIKEHDDLSPSKINTPSKYFYFYQAIDGQHIYLHSLNVHMLEHVYGSLEFCPSTISGQIIEKEGGSMTEDLRKKFRYIQHLPVTCQFEVAEIQLKPPLVTKETTKVFQDQIEIRRKRRQQRAKEERKREKRIAEEENRMMGRFSTPHIRIESHRHFPQFMGSPEDDKSIFSESSQAVFTEGNSTPSNSELSVSPEQSQYIKKDATVSFAKMVTTAKPQVSTWPVLNSKPSRDVSTPILIPVTGSSMKTRTRTTYITSDDEPDPEGYVPAPTYNKSFSDAIALAMEQSFNSQSEEATSGKKKKKQKKILFSTSMVFTGK